VPDQKIVGMTTEMWGSVPREDAAMPLGNEGETNASERPAVSSLPMCNSCISDPGILPSAACPKSNSRPGEHLSLKMRL
jgi:hypothetical protein